MGKTMPLSEKDDEISTIFDRSPRTHFLRIRESRDRKSPVEKLQGGTSRSKSGKKSSVYADYKQIIPASKSMIKKYGLNNSINKSIRSIRSTESSFER